MDAGQRDAARQRGFGVGWRVITSFTVHLPDKLVGKNLDQKVRRVHVALVKLGARHVERCDNSHFCPPTWLLTLMTGVRRVMVCPHLFCPDYLHLLHQRERF